jgi:6-phosphogluconolactonase (cycloisomerase 2 family)
VALWSTAAFSGHRHDKGVAGAVYAMTNAIDDNRVLIFERDREGLLTSAGSVSTDGVGSGGGLDPLASQGSLVLTKDNRWLLAVNAGSNEISVFRVRRDGLDLVDRVDSGGEFPVSVAVFHDLVYVLNAGGVPNVTGFFLNHRGRLIAREQSTRELGSGGFAQVGVDPRGDNLVVTDRDENEILVFPLGRKGLPAIEPVTSLSTGIAPFGFVFDHRGNLLVSEAGSGAVSYYAIKRDGSLRVISPSVENGQAATCWIANNRRGYVFTANTGSQTLSAYSLVEGKSVRHELHRWRGRHGGGLELLDATAGFGNRPIDMDISRNGRFLYALDPGSETIDIFEIEADGSLTDLGTVGGGLSIFAQGIAAR